MRHTAEMWIAFRQPVLREAARRAGKITEFTYETNPGEVWEEDEFWIELSWRIDPDGSLGIRKHFLSPYRKGEKINIDEYYQYIFENVKGLPEAAAKEGLDPLAYMKKYGAFEIEKTSYNKFPKELQDTELQNAAIDEKTGLITQNGKEIGVMVDGKAHVGFPTPTRKQEFFSQTMVDWKWGEYSIPTYIKSHIHPSKIDSSKGEFPACSNFPTARVDSLPLGKCQMAHRNRQPQPHLDAHFGCRKNGHQNGFFGAHQYRHRLFCGQGLGDGRHETWGDCLFASLGTLAQTARQNWESLGDEYGFYYGGRGTGDERRWTTDGRRKTENGK